ncbi:hypothetical protein [Cohnella panacarvi]|uniref:hypothetical protein n=1 Tax=Cohnella panacarvi TaxID=400776 RepID=UPI00047ABC1A|nr:hypothetical protein [Cohnella panacarvi]
MGTRLLSEQLIRSRYPHFRYVRIHTHGRNAATIYAWNEDLRLTEPDKAELKRFASGYLTSYVCFQIKDYPSLKTDNVPEVFELPERILQAAMSRTLDINGIVNVINGLFLSGVLTYSRYDPIKGTIYFDVRTTCAVTEIEKQLIGRYLYEMVPLGANFEVTYVQTVKAVE